jgi:hypothetical protein
MAKRYSRDNPYAPPVEPVAPEPTAAPTGTGYSADNPFAASAHASAPSTPAEPWGLLDSTANGILFGFADNVAAAISAGVPGAARRPAGATYGERYAKALSAVRAGKRQYEEAHGGRALAGEIVGGVLPAVASGGASLVGLVPEAGSAAGTVARVGSALARGGARAAEGAAYGALAGAGNADGRAVGTATGMGAGVGAAVGLAAPPIVSGAARLLEAPATRAARLVARGLERAGTSVEGVVNTITRPLSTGPRVPIASYPGEVLADMGGDQLRRLADYVGMKPSAGSERLVDFLERRALGRGQRLNEAAGEVLGVQRGNVVDTQQALAAAKQANGDRLYGIARATPPVADESVLAPIAEDEVLREAHERARRMVERRTGVKQPPLLTGAPTEMPAAPPLGEPVVSGAPSAPAVASGPATAPKGTKLDELLRRAHAGEDVAPPMNATDQLRFYGALTDDALAAQYRRESTRVMTENETNAAGHFARLQDDGSKPITGQSATGGRAKRQEALARLRLERVEKELKRRGFTEDEVNALWTDDAPLRARGGTAPTPTPAAVGEDIGDELPPPVPDFVEYAPPGEAGPGLPRFHPQSVGVLDWMKQGGDDVIQTGLEGRRKIGQHEARTSLAKLHGVLAALDEVRPEYQAARAQFADDSALEDALAMGQRAFEPTVMPEQLAADFAATPKPAQSLARQGALRSLYGKTEGVDPGGVRSLNFFRQPVVQQKLDALAANDAGRAGMPEVLRREMNMARTERDALRNSRSLNRAETIRDVEGDGLAGALQKAMQAARSPFSAAVGMAGRLTAGVNEATANSLADLLLAGAKDGNTEIVATLRRVATDAAQSAATRAEAERMLRAVLAEQSGANAR